MKCKTKTWALAVTAGLVLLAGCTMNSFEKMVAEYTVSYDANGAEGQAPLPDKTMIQGQSVTLASADGISKEGFVFAAWNTAQDGSGMSYQPGDFYKPTADITFYAQWSSVPTPTVTYTVEYNSNGADGLAPQSVTVTEGGSVTLPGQGGMSKNDYTFVGWNTQADGSGTSYAAGGILTVTGDITLYAQWAYVYIITYNANGGGGTPPVMQTVPKDGTVQERTVTVGSGSGLSRAGWGFREWNTYANGAGQPYAPEADLIVHGDVILYAYWGRPRAFYDTNGETGGELPFPETDNMQTLGEGETKLKTAYNDGDLEKAGWAFAGWSTEPGEPGKPETWGTLYAEGADLPDTDNYLYPQWDYAYTVGSVTRSGGIIFYDDEADGIDDIPGYRFLEAAPADIPGHFEWGGWRSSAPFISCSTGTGIGTGAANTAALVTHDHDDTQYGSHTHDAARACADYEVTVEGVTYDDWFLPSKDELALMYERKGVIGGFSDYGYWSSSQYDDGVTYAWCQNLSNGAVEANGKPSWISVRPVRAFNRE